MPRPTAREAVEEMLRANAYVDPGTPPGCMVVLSGINLSEGHEDADRHLAELRGQDRAKARARIARGPRTATCPPGPTPMSWPTAR